MRFSKELPAGAFFFSPAPVSAGEGVVGLFKGCAGFPA
jgi:hypothetical protein